MSNYPAKGCNLLQQETTPFLSPDQQCQSTKGIHLTKCVKYKCCE